MTQSKRLNGDLKHKKTTYKATIIAGIIGQVEEYKSMHLSIKRNRSAAVATDSREKL